MLLETRAFIIEIIDFFTSENDNTYTKVNYEQLQGSLGCRF